MNTIIPNDLSSAVQKNQWTKKDHSLFERVWKLIESPAEDVLIQDLRERLSLQILRSPTAAALSGRRIEEVELELSEQTLPAPTQEQVLILFQEVTSSDQNTDLERISNWLRVSCRWMAADRAAHILQYLPPAVSVIDESEMNSPQIDSLSGEPSRAPLETRPLIIETPEALSRHHARRALTPIAASAAPSISRMVKQRSVNRPQTPSSSGTSLSSPNSRSNPQSPQSILSSPTERASPLGRSLSARTIEEILEDLREAAAQKGNGFRNGLKELSMALHHKRPQPSEVVDILRCFGTQPEAQRAVLRLFLEAIPSGVPKVWTEIWEEAVHRFPHPTQRPLLMGLVSQLLGCKSCKLSVELVEVLYQWTRVGAADEDVIKGMLRLGKWDAAWIDQAAREVRGIADLNALRGWFRSEAIHPADRLILLAQITLSATKPQPNYTLLVHLTEFFVQLDEGAERGALLEGVIELVLEHRESAQQMFKLMRNYCQNTAQLQQWMEATLRGAGSVDVIADAIVNLEGVFREDLWVQVLQTGHPKAWDLFECILIRQWPWKGRQRADLQRTISGLMEGSPNSSEHIMRMLAKVPPEVAVGLFDYFGAAQGKSSQLIERRCIGPLLVRFLTVERIEQLLSDQEEVEWARWFAQEASQEVLHDLKKRWEEEVFHQPNAATRGITAVLLQGWARRFHTNPLLTRSFPSWVRAFFPIVGTSVTSEQRATAFLFVLKVLSESYRGRGIDPVECETGAAWSQQIQREGVPDSVISILQENLEEINWDEVSVATVQKIGILVGEQLEHMIQSFSNLLEEEVNENKEAIQAKRPKWAALPWARFWRFAALAGPAAMRGLDHSYVCNQRYKGEIAAALQTGLMTGMRAVPFWNRLDDAFISDFGVSAVRAMTFEHSSGFHITDQNRQILRALLEWVETREPSKLPKALDAVLGWLDCCILSTMNNDLEIKEMIDVFRKLLILSELATDQREISPEGISYRKLAATPILSFMMGMVFFQHTTEAVAPAIELLEELIHGRHGPFHEGVQEYGLVLTHILWGNVPIEEAFIRGKFLANVENAGDKAKNQPLTCFPLIRIQLLRAYGHLDRKENGVDSRVALIGMLCHALRSEIANGPGNRRLWDALGGSLAFRIKLLINSDTQIQAALSAEEISCAVPFILGKPFFEDIPDTDIKNEEIMQQLTDCQSHEKGSFAAKILFWRAMLNKIYEGEATVQKSRQAMKFVRALLKDAEVKNFKKFIDAWFKCPKTIDLNLLHRIGILKPLEITSGAFLKGIQL